MKTKACAGATLLVAILLPFFLAGSSPAPDGDELAWKALVRITSTDGAATPPGQAAAGWRFWASREYLFPARGGTPPVDAVSTAYRNFVCTPQTLPPRARVDRASEFCEASFFSPDTAKTVIDNQLYWRENLVSYVKNLDSSGQSFKFPSGAREIKTEWKILERDDAGSGYFVAQNSDTLQRYALVALHLQSHELSSSLWATWIHQDYLDKMDRFPIVDSFGGVGEVFPSRKLHKFLEANFQLTWLNYRLIGTQVSPDKRQSLGNPLIEGLVFDHLEESSCMSCHSQAAVGKTRGNITFSQHVIPGVLSHPGGELVPLDFDLSLTMAPKCKNGHTLTCSELTRLFPDSHSPLQMAQAFRMR